MEELLRVSAEEFAVQVPAVAEPDDAPITAALQFR